MTSKNKKPKFTLAQKLAAERAKLKVEREKLAVERAIRSLKYTRRKLDRVREDYHGLRSGDPHVVQITRRRILRQMARRMRVRAPK